MFNVFTLKRLAHHLAKRNGQKFMFVFILVQCFMFIRFLIFHYNNRPRRKTELCELLDDFQQLNAVHKSLYTESQITLYNDYFR